MNSKTIICDLDGTLFNVDHRLHLLLKKDWNAFFEAAKDDTPNEWCVLLLDAMISQAYDIAFISGRNESALSTTEEQLAQLGYLKYPLFMRKKADRRPDFELKSEIFDKNFKREDILFVLEDRDQVAKMWRSKGLTVLHCDEGEF